MSEEGTLFYFYVCTIKRNIIIKFKKINKWKQFPEVKELMIKSPLWIFFLWD